jgi:BirA family transcriptional regulator, biotin operon repressor / biotin---[acetyl-CoA-carboxylase] ligase
MSKTHHEDLHVESLAALLHTARFGRSLEIRERTDSTNDDARAAASAGCADGHVVLADAQTRGRGSRGRSWDSPPGTDLYLSIVARLDVPLASIAPLTLAVGLAVAECVEQLLTATGPGPGAGARADIKWPNDVWVRGRKIAGILVEGASLGQTNLPLVIGIGLNVNRQQFPEGLDTPATSLRLELGSDVPRGAALALLLTRVEAAVDRFAAGGLTQIAGAVDQRLCLRDQRAQCDGVSGIVRGVAASGALRFEVEGQLRELFSGTLRPA